MARCARWPRTLRRSNASAACFVGAVGTNGGSRSLLTMGVRSADGTITADYTRTPLGTWRITVTSRAAGTTTVEGQGPLPVVVEEVVMPVVQAHTDRARRPCVTIHTLDGDATEFMAAYHSDDGGARP